MKKVFLILITIIALGCKNEKNETKSIPETETIGLNEIEQTKEFIAKISYRTNKDDEFKIMLNNIVQDEFQRKNIYIIEKVVSNSVFENITANFGEVDNLPNEFHINFGVKEIKEVEIESIELTYGKNNLIINAAELKDYFNFNKYVEHDSVSNKFTTKNIDGVHYPTILLKIKGINALKQE